MRATSDPICLVALAALLAGACDRREASAEPSPPLVAARSVSSAPSAVPAAARLVDPLAPHRELGRVAGPVSDAGDDWRTRRPSKGTQLSLGVRDRRVNPCEAPEPGSGVHDDWIHVRPMGQFIAPRASPLDANGEVDLVVHFHGHRPARKEFVRTGEDLVLLGVSLGIGAAYGPPFSDPDLFAGLVSRVEQGLARRYARPKVRVRRIALTSWSRGYEAIERILHQPVASRVDALVLLDSLHASREPARQREQLAPFVSFAERAARGETFFFASHSSIDTSDYASTTETVHALVAAVGGRPVAVARRDPLGLDLIEMFSEGSFHARGYSGNGKLDHCAHFGVYPDAIRALARRWRG